MQIETTQYKRDARRFSRLIEKFTGIPQKQIYAFIDQYGISQLATQGPKRMGLDDVKAARLKIILEGRELYNKVLPEERKSRFTFKSTRSVQRFFNAALASQGEAAGLSVAFLSGSNELLDYKAYGNRRDDIGRVHSDSVNDIIQTAVKHNAPKIAILSTPGEIINKDILNKMMRDTSYLMEQFQPAGIKIEDVVSVDAQHMISLKDNGLICDSAREMMDKYEDDSMSTLRFVNRNALPRQDMKLFEPLSSWTVAQRRDRGRLLDILRKFTGIPPRVLGNIANKAGFAGLLDGAAKLDGRVTDTQAMALDDLRRLDSLYGNLSQAETRRDYVLASPSEAGQYFVDYFKRYGNERDATAAVFMDGESHVIRTELLSNAGVGDIALYGRMILEKAMQYRSKDVLIGEYSPSQGGIPGQADILQAERMKELVERFGIRYHDNIVVCRDKTHSMMSNRELVKPEDDTRDIKYMGHLVERLNEELSKEKKLRSQNPAAQEHAGPAQGIRDNKQVMSMAEWKRVMAAKMGQRDTAKKTPNKDDKNR